MIEHALREAGAKDELLQALVSDKKITKSIVEFGQAMLLQQQSAQNAAERRQAMEIGIADTTVFTTRVGNLLMRRGINSLGDVCMMTATDLDHIHQMGPRGVLEIMHVLATYRLELRGELEEPIKHALWLYGEAAHIPSRLMPLWVSRLDGRTRDILDEYATLGELVTLTGDEFMHEAYGYRRGELVRTPKNQMLKVAAGLRAVDLSFRDE